MCESILNGKKNNEFSITVSVNIILYIEIFSDINKIKANILLFYHFFDVFFIISMYLAYKICSSRH